MFNRRHSISPLAVENDGIENRGKERTRKREREREREEEEGEENNDRSEEVGEERCGPANYIVKCH